MNPAREFVAMPDRYPGQITWHYDRIEIIADGVVHAIGVCLGFIGAVAIVVMAVKIERINVAPILVYVIGLVTMLAFSAAYNMWPVSPIKWVLRRFDHSAIYLLIAATYTQLPQVLDPKLRCEAAERATLRATFLPKNNGRSVPMGTVLHIYVAAHRGAPMQRLDAVTAVEDQGLVGDRYIAASNRRSPDYQITLIQAEHIEDFSSEHAIAFTPDMPRRNIVTRGTSLNDLRGKRFRVGNVLLEGLELCEPCALFAKRTDRAVLRFFRGKGGLRARIVAGGQIRVGDAIIAEKAPD